MHELTIGIFSWMCLEKRVVKSTWSVGKLMKPRRGKQKFAANWCAQWDITVYINGSRLWSLSYRHPRTKSRTPLTRHKNQIIIGAGGAIKHLRKHMIQIIPISSFNESSCFSRQGVFHSLQLVRRCSKTRSGSNTNTLTYSGSSQYTNDDETYILKTNGKK